MYGNEYVPREAAMLTGYASNPSNVVSDSGRSDAQSAVAYHQKVGAAVNMPEIHREAASAHKSAENLHQLLANLVERLGPVMHSQPPTAEDSQKTGRALAGTKIGGEFLQIGAQIDEANEALRQVLNRLAI